MKKIAALLLTLAMLFAMCACTDNDKAYSSTTATDITKEEMEELIKQAQEAQESADSENPVTVN